MARRKQVVPLQRQPSDFSAGPPESPNHGWQSANGKPPEQPPKAINGDAKEPLVPIVPTSPKEAGFTQLIICVGGIYASLYAFPSPPRRGSFPAPTNPPAVSPGPSSKSA